MLKRGLVQRFGGGWWERLGFHAVSAFQLWQLSAHKDRELVRLIWRIRWERKSLLSAFEAFLIYSLVKTFRDCPGDLAEVGVFEGASAKLICEAKGGCPLHLFDTFTGLPLAAPQDRGVHRPDQYACKLTSVQHYLAPYDNVYYYPGRFPETTKDLPERCYSFVHLDVDLYQSTQACLEYFYPRMTSGGAIVLHDYSILNGVHQAVDEFMADKPERLIEQPTTQCVIFKR